MFVKPNLKRCHSDDINCASDLYPENGIKKHRKSESSIDVIPEDLISLSMDLLNQIQQHENSSETSGYISSSSYSSPNSSSSCSSSDSPKAPEIMTVGCVQNFYSAILVFIKFSFCLFFNVRKRTGPSCSKLMTSLVVLLKFQTLMSQICQYFCRKNLRSFCTAKASLIFQQKISVYLVIKL